MEEEGKIKVYQVIKSSPAEKAKIKEGDEILSIDQIPVSNYSLQQIRDILNQNEKSKIILNIKSLDKTKEVKLTLKELL
jgi:C-terminal processing protease CtpA/Prc